MSNATVRLAICAVLFTVWIALVAFQLPGDGQIIDVIKYTLAMLGGYHAGDRINLQTAAASIALPINAATSSAVPNSKEST